MTILLIVVFVVVASAGYIAYKIGTPDITELKQMATKALDKIEPALHEASEILEKAEKAIPENEVLRDVTENVTMAAKKVKKEK